MKHFLKICIYYILSILFTMFVTGWCGVFLVWLIKGTFVFQIIKTPLDFLNQTSGLLTIATIVAGFAYLQINNDLNFISEERQFIKSLLAEIEYNKGLIKGNKEVIAFAIRQLNGEVHNDIIYDINPFSRLMTECCASFINKGIFYRERFKNPALQKILAELFTVIDNCNTTMDAIDLHRQQYGNTSIQITIKDYYRVADHYFNKFLHTAQQANDLIEKY